MKKTEQAQFYHINPVATQKIVQKDFVKGLGDEGKKTRMLKKLHRKILIYQKHLFNFVLEKKAATHFTDAAFFKIDP